MKDKKLAICFDKRPCFARSNKECLILYATYPENKCPFCKPEQNVTKGVVYPFNQYHGRKL